MLKRKRKQEKTIFNGYELVRVRVINWSKFRVQKKANLDQLITIKICAGNLFALNICWNPYFIPFLSNIVKKQTWTS